MKVIARRSMVVIFISSDLFHILPEVSILEVTSFNQGFVHI